MLMRSTRRLRMCQGIGPRSAITLLEVLISIMCLSVGLLGLATLLPLGRFQLVEASRLDRTGTLGRSAFRDLQVRGYLQPDMLLHFNSASNTFVPVLTGTTLTVGPSPPFVTAVPFAIDPYGVGGSIGSNPHLAFLATLPYGVMPSAATAPYNQAPVIPRLSVRSWVAPITPGLAPVMPFSQAERIFATNDELILAEGAKANYRPQPVLEGIPPIRVQSEGNFTWLVTVSPSFGELFGTVSIPGDATSTRLYTATVVVLFKRNAQSDKVDLTLSLPDRNERLVWCEFLDNGVGGGNVRLRTATVGPNPLAEAAELLKLRVGEWIMITGAPAAAAPPFLQWYRVAAIDSGPQADPSGEYFRDVTLAGPDWVPSLFVDPVNYVYGDIGGGHPTAFATIFTGAMAAYEKTITLDGSSDWSH